MKSKFFSTNIELKIASLLLAVTLWFFVILSGRAEITIDIPIEFSNIPSNLDIVEAPETLSVRIEGQERLLRGLKQQEINAVIDVKESNAGRVFFTITKDNIKVPGTFVVTDIDPETVSVKLEDQLKKTVAVKPAVFGLPEKGFVIVDIEVAPEKIEIEGPASAISKIYTIKTEPIDINGINSDLKYRANLELSDANIRKSVNKVEVHIVVKQIRQGNAS